jgi:hypothetical protein
MYILYTYFWPTLYLKISSSIISISISIIIISVKN